MAKAKIICPMMSGECIEDGSIRDGELVACRFWITIQGKHPQTGETVNNGDCAIAWMPILLIENSKVNRETGAAVESFRNEMVRANESSQRMLAQAATMNSKMIEVK